MLQQNKVENQEREDLGSRDRLSIIGAGQWKSQEDSHGANLENSPSGRGRAKIWKDVSRGKKRNYGLVDAFEYLGNKKGDCR